MSGIRFRFRREKIFSRWPRLRHGHVGQSYKKKKKTKTETENIIIVLAIRKRKNERRRGAFRKKWSEKRERKKKKGTVFTVRGNATYQTRVSTRRHVARSRWLLTLPIRQARRADCGKTENATRRWTTKTSKQT